MTVRLEVATAGRPVEAVARVAREFVAPGSVYRIGVAHDDACPCIAAGAPMTGCSCEIVELTIEVAA